LFLHANKKKAKDGHKMPALHFSNCQICKLNC
jgi:hypothetical protein